MRRKHECGRCGTRDTAERLFYSPHTRKRYCCDIDACDQRVAQRAAWKAPSEEFVRQARADIAVMDMSSTAGTRRA